MILRKPYAFFIKFFKIFHLIIFCMSAVLLYRTSLIYDFMREFCKDSPNVIGKNLVSSLFVPWVYILVLIILFVNIIIIFVLIRKVKPYAFYIFSISLYIGVLVIFIVSNGVISDMQQMLLPAKTTLAIRDINNISRLLQFACVVFYLVRATGFDIKKFDFVRDLHGMDISDEDSEEIEVAVEFEGNVILRNFKRKFREFKYYYKENKFVINIVSLFVIGIASLIIYFNFNKYDKVYNENDYISVSGYNLGVKKSYILSKDYFNKSFVDNNHVLVVLDVSMRSNFGESISNSRSLLVVNGTQYYPTNSYSSGVIDLGNVYNEQPLSNDFSNYLFVYIIPKNVLSSDIVFRYVDSVEYKRGKTFINSVDVKLDPINLDSVELKNTSLNFGDSISDYNFVLNSYELSNMFVNTYNSCITSNECYDFREVLRPSVISNHDKVLLKIDTGDSLNVSSLISKYGSIEYIYNGSNYVENSDFNFIVPSKTTNNGIYYIEVNKEIMDASSIKLVFNFRNVKYSYVLRGENNE